MKKYVVREQRLPVFRKLDLYTPKGLIDLSFREHPGLRIGNFFNLNAGIAYEMIVDEELRAEKMDLQDLVRIMSIEGDTTDAKAQHEADVEQAYMANSPTRPR